MGTNEIILSEKSLNLLFDGYINFRKKEHEKLKQLLLTKKQNQMSKTKENLLSDYISLNKKMLETAKSVTTFTPKELKEKVIKMSEKEKQIKFDLNKLGYQIYWSSSKKSYDLRKMY